MKYHFIGKNKAQVDARAKVTGDATYTVDVSFPNMLWGKLLRSPLPHAEILNIDTKRAERVVGVKAVVTGEETPNVCSVTEPWESVLQNEKVRYVGDPVAAVAAVDLDAAREALDLIKVDYRELPAVFDAEEAIKPGAPVLYKDKKDNIAATSHYQAGDIEEAFKEADYLFEDRFETQRVAHVCPEPHNCVALWDRSGRLTFYISSQSPSLDRLHLSEVLKMQESKIRVITNHVGGGFGSKVMSKLPINLSAILLARKSGMPVKMVHTREEEFPYSTFAHKFIITVKTGVMKDGTIVGRHFEVICDCGAHAFYGPVVLAVGGAMQGILYRFKHYRYDGYAVYTNLPYGGAFRGVGNPQVTFAGETQLNVIAKKLGIDPLEIRQNNMIRPEEKTSIGAFVTSCGLAECLESAAKKIGWKRNRDHPKPHRGMALVCNVHLTGARLPGMPDADFGTADMTINDDGSVNLAVPCIDMGQGSTTVMTQIAAEVLGIEMERIHTIFGDTETCPMGWGTRGSRSTAICGTAVKRAAESVREQLLRVASEKLKIDPHTLDIKEGKVYSTCDPKISMRVAEVVRFNRYRQGGGAITASGYWDAPSSGNVSFAFSFGAKAVEVEIDPETGQISILNVAAAQDVGMAINPLAAVGQIQGGVHQGIGMASCEEIVLGRTGGMVNNTLLDYPVLTALDMPPVSPLLIESLDPVGPFGAKGLGEMALLGMPDAIASAVFDATGILIRKLPITPEKVLFKMKKRR